MIALVRANPLVSLLQDHETEVRAAIIKDISSFVDLVGASTFASEVMPYVLALLQDVNLVSSKIVSSHPDTLKLSRLQFSGFPSSSDFANPSRTVQIIRVLGYIYSVPCLFHMPTDVRNYRPLCVAERARGPVQRMHEACAEAGTGAHDDSYLADASCISSR